MATTARDVGELVANLKFGWLAAGSYVVAVLSGSVVIWTICGLSTLGWVISKMVSINREINAEDD